MTNATNELDNDVYLLDAGWTRAGVVRHNAIGGGKSFESPVWLDPVTGRRFFAGLANQVQSERDLAAARNSGTPARKRKADGK